MNIRVVFKKTALLLVLLPPSCSSIKQYIDGSEVVRTSSACKVMNSDYGPYRVEFCEQDRTIEFHTYQSQLTFYRAGYERSLRTMLRTVFEEAYGDPYDTKVEGEYWIKTDALEPSNTHGMLFVRHSKQNFLLEIDLDPRLWQSHHPLHSYILGRLSYPRYAGLNGHELEVILKDETKRAEFYEKALRFNIRGFVKAEDKKNRVSTPHLLFVDTARLWAKEPSLIPYIRQIQYIPQTEELESRLLAFDFNWDLKDP